MGKVTEEMIAKAKTAKSAEELIAIAKEAGIELNEEEAKVYFEQLNPKSGELSDDELDNVSGGGCKRKGKTVVTNGCKCFMGCYENNLSSVRYDYDRNGYQVKLCDYYRNDHHDLRMTWDMWCGGKEGVCGTCRYLDFQGGIGVCGKS